MIKLKHLLNEADQKAIGKQLSNLYAQYRKLLAQMYGPNGTETRKAAALVKHMSAQAGTFGAKKATSPEFDKAESENRQVMKQISDVGRKMNDLYKQLEDLGKEDLVKRMRQFQSKETEKYVKSLANQAETKAVQDAQANNQSLKSDQKKAIDSLEKEMEKKREQYRMDYRKWLQGTQDTPPPLPPQLPINK